MRAARRLAPILYAALLLGVGGAAPAASTGAPGTTLYVNRLVMAPPGNVSLGTLVRSPTPPSPAQQEALSRSATILEDSLQYLPVSEYQARLVEAFGTDAILVGSWSLVVARGTSAEGEGYLLGRLADYLISQGFLSDSRVDMSFTLGSLTGSPPQDGTPVFQLVKTARTVEISFTLSGSDGSSVAGRVTLPASSAGQTADEIGSNAAVRVVFRRGLVTVEMPGRALSRASVGDTLRVFVPDSQKTFTGRLVDAKVVQVDLP